MLNHTAEDVKNWFLAWTYDLPEADIKKTKMMKLLYYAQGYSCAILGKPIFPDEIKAFEYGPVVDTVYEEIKEYPDRTSLKLEVDFDFSQFSEEENQLLANVWETFGTYSSNELSDKTHLETPWIEASDRGLKTVMDIEGIEQYFIEQVYFNFLETDKGKMLKKELLRAA